MKKRNDYFEMMEKLVGFSVAAAELLVQYLSDFHPETVSARRKEMHGIEHRADEARHEILKKLSREFITPIERDDILRLIQIIDDVTDAIDDVTIKLYMFSIRQLPGETLMLAERVRNCVQALAAAIAELRNFKKPDKLGTLLVEINNLESEADEVHIEAVRLLFVSGRDPLSILGVREIYDCLESCCDLCEHAADVIEDTVMKNT